MRSCKNYFFKNVNKAFICLVMIGLMTNISFQANATHFRYGNITWTWKGTPSVRTVTFHIQEAWRWSAFGNPAVNTTVSNPDGGINWGDGSSATTIGLKVTSVNAAEDWFFGEATIDHTFLGTGTSFTVFFSSCCRISS